VVHLLGHDLHAQRLQSVVERDGAAGKDRQSIQASVNLPSRSGPALSKVNPLSFRAGVPELTRSAGIQLNKQVSLRHH
jgi:hypothetical protein